MIIGEKNYIDWNDAKILIEKILTNDSRSDYYITDSEWSHIIENMLKIKDHNNLKEFQILNVRNNLYFNLKKSKMKKKVTDMERKEGKK